MAFSLRKFKSTHETKVAGEPEANPNVNVNIAPTLPMTLTTAPSPQPNPTSLGLTLVVTLTFTVTLASAEGTRFVIVRALKLFWLGVVIQGPYTILILPLTLFLN